MKTKWDNLVIRARNTLTIQSTYDLKKLFSEPVCLSGDIEEEIAENAWHIWARDENCEKKIKAQALESFFDRLICAKKKQIGNRQATLYVWVEGKFNQLCYNIISGITTDLPFRRQFEEVQLSTLIYEYVNVLQDGPQTTFFGIRNEDIDDDNYGCYEFSDDYKVKVYIKFLNEIER